MLIRLALSLDVTTDELLGIKLSKNKNNKSNFKIQKRMKDIQKLPATQQRTLLKTIDTFIKASQLEERE